MEILDQIIKALSDNSSAIGIVMGILFTIAKAASNEKAGVIVGSIQKVVDMIASIVVKSGQILSALSNILANMIKSDGILGKK
jgi:hypothetical protein